jgi:hypothetical protein
MSTTRSLEEDRFAKDLFHVLGSPAKVLATKGAPAMRDSASGLNDVFRSPGSSAFFAPRSVVGELCPFVSPYTLLSHTRIVMSSRRRIVWRK